MKLFRAIPKLMKLEHRSWVMDAHLLDFFGLENTDNKLDEQRRAFTDQLLSERERNAGRQPLMASPITPTDPVK